MNLKRNHYLTFINNFWLTVLIFIISVISFYFYVQGEKALDRANETRFQSHFLIENLRLSTDQMTHMSRNYVVTGNPVNKLQYFEILDIREGKKPYPVDKNNFYWDLMDDESFKSLVSSGESISILDLMQREGLTTEELLKAKEAKLHSDSLAKIEMQAMHLVDTKTPTPEADRMQAIEMLYSSEYKKFKIKIMKPISDLYDMVEKRTLAEVHAAEDFATFLRIIFMLIGVLFIAFVGYYYRALQKTLGASMPEVYSHISRIGRGNFSTPIVVPPRSQNSIISWLDETQTKLKNLDDQHKETRRQLLKSTASLDFERTQLQTVIETIPDLIWLKDVNGLYLTCNLKFETLYGAKKDDIIGKSDYDFTAKEYADSYRKYDNLAIEKGKSSTNEEYVLFADGHIELTETTKTPMYDSTGKIVGVLGVGHNITALKESELREKSRSHILELIAMDVSLTDILDAIILGIEEHKPEMIGSILLLDSSGKHLLSEVAPSLPQEYIDAIHGVKIGEGVGSCGTAAYTGSRVVVENIDEHAYWNDYKAYAQKAKLKSCWSEPITSSKGTILGTFAIYHKEVKKPTQDNITLIEQASSLASIAIDHHNAKRELNESKERLALASLYSGVGIWDWDLVTDYLIWDDLMLSLYHIKKPEVGKSLDIELWKKTLHPDDIDRIMQEVQDAIDGKKPYDTEFRYILPNGDIRYMKAVANVFYDEDAKPLRMLGTNIRYYRRKSN